MNNKRLLILAALCLGTVMFPAQLLGQSETAEYFINPEMSLTINLEKDTFIQWEPIVVRSRFENKTEKGLSTLIPSIISEGSIIVESGGEKKEFGELSIFRSLLARQPVTLAPGQGSDEELTLERGLDDFFPKTGLYVIRIVLNGKDGKAIVSNPIEIKIEGATGIDKEALEFIKRNKSHSRYPMLFTWNSAVTNDDGKTLLEEFVSKYRHSVYGDYAVYQLGNYYFGRREFDKAKIELNKLKNSPIPKLAKAAREALSDVEKNRSSQ
jgi:hypothetical protein